MSKRDILSKIFNDLDLSLKSIIYAFELKQGLDFDYEVEDGNLFSPLMFGDYFFDIKDIIFDVKNEVEVGVILEWHDMCVENELSSTSFSEYVRKTEDGKSGLELYVRSLKEKNDLSENDREHFVDASDVIDEPSSFKKYIDE